MPKLCHNAEKVISSVLARVPGWFEHVERALTELRDFPAPVLGRADVERLLHLSRRDAIRFLHRCGAKEHGDRLEISRNEAIRQLEFIRGSGEYQAEMRRRARLAERQEEAARQAAGRNMQLPVPAMRRGREARSLPPTVRLYRTRLVVDFAEGDIPGLLGELLEVARTARDDPEGFREAVMEGGDADA